MDIKKTALPLLAALCALASLPSLYAMCVQTGMPKPIEYFNKNLRYKDPVLRILDLTKNLPPEILQSPKFTNQAFKNFSHVDYFNYYEALKDIKRVVLENIDTENEDKYADLIEQVIDSKTQKPFKRFKGDNLMANLQGIAVKKVGKILNCTSEELENGTCQPLKNSTNPVIPVKEKEAMPFRKELNDKWTRNWLGLLLILPDFTKELWFKAPDWKEVFTEKMHAVHSRLNSNNDNNPIRLFPHKGELAILISPFSSDAIERLYVDLFPPAIQEALIEMLLTEIRYDKNREIRIEVPGNLTANAMIKEIFLKKLQRIPEIKDFFDISVKYATPVTWDSWMYYQKDSKIILVPRADIDLKESIDELENHDVD